MTKKIDYKIFIAFLAIATQILVMSYISYKGGLTADSKNYLNLSQNILDGHGLFVKDLYSETGRTYFTVWPAGYSFMISSVASILPVDLVLASKLVNIILIGLILWIFSKKFGSEAYLFGSLFLIDSVARLTYRTWVQTPFIAGLILLAFALYYFYYHRRSIKWIILIIASCLLLFMSRYIGLTGLIAIAALGCYLFYKKDYKSFFILAFSGIVVLTLAAIYLYYNYLQSGHLTGMPRIDSPEDTSWMIRRYFSRQLEEFKFPAIAALLTYIVYKYFRKNPKKEPIKYRNAGKLWPFFLLVGATYLIPVIILRFNVRFDDFGGRMFAPATLLFMMALLDYMHANSRYYGIFKNCLLTVLVGSFLYHVPVKMVRSLWKDKPTYLEHRQNLEEKYASLEPSSIVLFGNYDLIYIRDDVQPANPFPFYGDYIYGRTYNGDFKEDIGKNESLKDYITRRCKLDISSIYMDISRWQPKAHGGYEAVQKFIDENKGKTLVKLANCR